MAAEAVRIRKEDRSYFDLKPVIELPETYPVTCFLTGRRGEEVLREAHHRAVNKYNSASPLMSPVYQDGVVKGSTSLFAVLIDEVLREDTSSQRLRVATPADIERTLRTGDVLGIKGNYYVDTALVLRSERDSYEPNDPLSRDVYTQLKRRLKRELKLPVMIPLRGLDLKLDDNPYGLGFTLRDDAEIIHDPILNRAGRFDSENINPKTGLPKRTGKEGSRHLYTREGGLSRLALDRNLNLNADWNNLGYSNAGGRVALCGEAAR